MLRKQADPAVEFNRIYLQGKAHLEQAIAFDEKIKTDSGRVTIVKACESYKKVWDLFSQARKVAGQIDTRSIAPDDKRKLQDTVDKITKFGTGVYDRYMALTKIVQEMDAVGASRLPTRPPGMSSSVPLRPTTPVVRRGSRNGDMLDFHPAKTRNEILRGVDRKFGERLLDECLTETGISMSDVSGCITAKSALEEAVILPALNPTLFTGLRQPVKGILMFGPPGNGKTMLAKAVANDTKHTFFNISAASLTSKWVGEGEKTVRTLFQMARNAQPCIIFVDEIDSILCSRRENEAESSRRLKTEFLIQFDGATSSQDEKILVIGATNRPHELDDAVLRRFPKRIFIPLPDDASRYNAIKQILHKHHMSKGMCDTEYKYIASRTSGYSYADLFAVCQEAAMVPIRGLDKTKLSKTSSSQIRPLKMSDFDHAVTVVRPSTNPENLQALQDFANRSGQTSL